MKTIKIIIICIWFSFLGINLKSQDVVEVRNLFYRSSTSSIASDSLFDVFENIHNENNAFSNAYKGMSNLMVCYHTYNPYKKIKYFINGKDFLEKAIAKNSMNVEYRFLRLSVQLNTPSFLGYNSNIERDKFVIFNGLKSLDDIDLLLRIADYTITAKNISDKEKAIVKLALKENKKYLQ